jgi:hypothetical protein
MWADIRKWLSEKIAPAAEKLEQIQVQVER